MLARQILKDAYKPILANGLEMNGVSAEIYRDMIVRQLGMRLAKLEHLNFDITPGQLAAERLAKPEDKGGRNEGENGQLGSGITRGTDSIR